MKKIAFVLALLILRTGALSLPSFALSAQSAVVMDAASGRVLYAHNADEKHGMASTTKIMTAICAIENSDINKTVTVSSNAAGVEGSSMYLSQGEKLSLHDLLYGLMLVSGNDAATAIAEAVSGSVDEFALLMNKKAAEIGAFNSSFTNPHGLSDENHYTTAADLAKITSYALSNPTFSEIVASKTKKLPQNEGGYARTLVNHNKFLNMYDGCVGVKTGFTKATGRCLVTAVRKNNMTLVCVTLNAPDDWNDHAAMYNSAFSEYSSVKIKNAGDKPTYAALKNGTAGEVALVVPEDVYVPLKSDEENSVEITAEAFEGLEAPVYGGDTLGKLTVSINGSVCGEFPLVADNGVPLKKVVFTASTNSFGAVFKKLFYAWVTCFV